MYVGDGSSYARERGMDAPALMEDGERSGDGEW
jgi:hypothetical protein